jgi:N-methylhydantoinase A
MTTRTPGVPTEGDEKMKIIGVDTGGTFTDYILIDTETGEKRITKSPSVPSQPEMGFLNAADAILKDLSAVDVCLHGTTVATNSIIQRSGAKVGLITTKGFRDILEIRRGNRPMDHAYDLQWEKPPSLVPRHLRVEVNERIAPDGEVLAPLREADVLNACRFLLKHGCKAVAVCFMESYRYPMHEDRAVSIIEEHFPGLHVSASSRILAQWREYERFSTAVADAFMKPVLDGYLNKLQVGLTRRGYRHSVMIMKSNGGVVTAEGARRLPVSTFSSGPAAGVVAGRFYGQMAGFTDVIPVDIGGTSADLSLIHDGQFSFTTESEITDGIPVKVPMIDVRSIGAGGGSIGWIDGAGALKVGPSSAGADPGPACYGQGGTSPTLTDANLILGRLAPKSFLGGAKELYPDLARSAMEDVLGKPLGIDATAASSGMIQVAVANMVKETRAISARKGWNPRQFALVAAGGAGPLHCPLIAREMEIPTVIVPPHPGLMSASGLLLSDLRFDSVQSLPCRLEEGGLELLLSCLADMAERVLTDISREGHRGETRVELSADMRYDGQNYEINIPVVGEEKKVEELAARFDLEHHRLYGFSIPASQHEIINARVTGIGVVDLQKVEKMLCLHPEGAFPTAAPNPKSTRLVFDELAHDYREAPVYDLLDLPRGWEAHGLAIIEEMDSTIYLPSDARAVMDSFGNFVIHLEGS